MQTWVYKHLSRETHEFKKIRIELDTAEIQQVLGIALDDDGEQALKIY